MSRSWVIDAHKMLQQALPYMDRDRQEKIQHLIDSSPLYQSQLTCPNCGNFETHWRSGFHFDHERYCGKCDYSWEPE